MQRISRTERTDEPMQTESFTHLEWQQATLESLAAAVITIDTQGRVVFMNSVAERLTGWPPSEAWGHRLTAIFHLVHEETGEVIENLARKALRSARVVPLTEPTALIDRDERVRPVKASAKAIRDKTDRLLGAVLTIHDITEQRRGEQRLMALNKMLARQLHKRTAALEQRSAELNAHEQSLAMALEAIQAGYYEHASSLESGYVSERWANLLGYRLDELPPLPALLSWWGSRLHGQDRQRVMQTYRRFIQGSSERFDIEYRIKHRHNGWRWQRLVSRAIQSSTATAARLVAGFVLDITEQKDATRRLRKLDEALVRYSARHHVLAVQPSRAGQSERRGLA